MPHSAAAVHLGRALTRPGAEHDAAAWVEVLAEVPLFAALSRRHLRKVAGVASIMRFHAETPIVRAGDAGDAFYVLLDGQVRVSRPRLPTLTLEAGSFFGELSLLDGGPRTATVTAKDSLACLTITRARFTKLLRAEPAIAVAMVEELARRLRAAQVTA